MRLTKLKNGLSRHLLLAGFCAVTVPLAAIFYMQYRSLAALEGTLPAQRRETLRQALTPLVQEIEEQFNTQAKRALDVPPASIQRTHTPVRNETEAVAAVQAAAAHFSRQQFAGARRYFIVVENAAARVNQCAIVYYDSARQAMALDNEVPEWMTILGASAPYLMAMRAGTPFGDTLIGSARIPSEPLLLKPIVDDRRRIVALAGLIVETKYLTQTLLPELSARRLPQLFPGQAATLRLRDHAGQVVYAGNAEASADNEERLPLRGALAAWTLGLQLAQLAVQQWARRNFYVTLALWALMSALLLGGVLLSLRTAQRALRLSQMKSDFVSNVSHELRTPLSSIRVLGELFKLGLVADPVKSSEYGAVIEAESRRLTQLVDNILDFSHIESGRRRYQFERRNLTQAVRETLETLDLRHRQEGFNVRLESPAPPARPVLMDAEALMQAFVNLLDNALKYSGDAREILVRLRDEANTLTLSITDYGVGIPAEEHERIFERFHRVSAGLVHEVKGSGLGLALVKHIVEAHGGHVTVQSEPGRGSTFTIHLPLEAQS